MNILSVIYKCLLALILLPGLTSSSEVSTWPVRGDVDLSSSFCDFRMRHFHGGVDIRTGGVEGREVFAPVDGYIWRIKYSYNGYGKALYLKDSRGFIYVFGHLSKLSDRLEKMVRQIQYESQRYYLDREFSPDSLSVKVGDLVAFSGQTGIGAPHIHFEKRDAANRPLNPLTNGFPIADHYAPEFRNFGLIYQDTISLFPDGQRRLVRKPRFDRAKKKYVVDSVTFIQAPFGVEIKAVDRLRADGPILGIYKARLFIDDYLYYETVFDKYDYDQTTMVDLCYDYYLASTRDENWSLMFNPEGKVFAGSKSIYENGGIYKGHTEHSYGLHNGRVEITDAGGNISELDFRFLLAPEGHLFEIERLKDSVFYLNGRYDNRLIDIKSVSVYALTGQQKWQQLKAGAVEKRGTLDFRVSLPHENRKSRALRIEVAGESGWKIMDQYIMLPAALECKYSLNYALEDGGILFQIKSPAKFSPPPRIDIIYEDGYIRSLETTPVGPNKFVAYYKNTQISTGIIRFDLYAPRATVPIESREVNIALAGVMPEQIVNPGSDAFEVSFADSSFYSPVFIQVSRTAGSYGPWPGRLVAPPYAIKPESFPLAGPIEISFKIDDTANRMKFGMYLLGKDRSVSWVDSKIKQNRMYAGVVSAGVYGVIEDTRAPSVTVIYPGDGKSISNAMPEIKCKITDELSGIKDDDNITALLDGQWLIPEYNHDILKSAPRAPLAEGKHELSIKVSDRVGNSRTVTSIFFVKKNQKK